VEQEIRILWRRRGAALRTIGKTGPTTTTLRRERPTFEGSARNGSKGKKAASRVMSAVSPSERAFLSGRRHVLVTGGTRKGKSRHLRPLRGGSGVADQSRKGGCAGVQRIGEGGGEGNRAAAPPCGAKAALPVFQKMRVRRRGALVCSGKGGERGFGVAGKEEPFSWECATCPGMSNQTRGTAEKGR